MLLCKQKIGINQNNHIWLSGTSLQTTIKEGARIYSGIMLTYGIKVSKLKTINNLNNCKVIFILANIAFNN